VIAGAGHPDRFPDANLLRLSLGGARCAHGRLVPLTQAVASLTNGAKCRLLRVADAMLNVRKGSSGNFIGTRNTRQVNTHAKAAMMTEAAPHRLHTRVQDLLRRDARRQFFELGRRMIVCLVESCGPTWWIRTILVSSAPSSGRSVLAA